MQQYLDLLKDIQDNGRFRPDRTGTGCFGVFGRQMRFDLGRGFPLLTTKKLHLRSIIVENLWFLAGDTNNNTLKDQDVRIWNEWAREDGRLGRVYGAQWRDWRSVVMEPSCGPGDAMPVVKHTDQISNLIKDLKGNPHSRRHMVVAWNPGELDQMALPPCHCLFQFYTEELTFEERRQKWLDGAVFGQDKGISAMSAGETPEKVAQLDAVGIPKFRLSCQLYQRSADVFLGVPFNIASYSLLTMMVAQVCNMVPGDFVHTFGDVHIYSDHVDQVRIQLGRKPHPLPRMRINPEVTDIFSFKLEDFELIGYNPDPSIKAKVSV